MDSKALAIIVTVGFSVVGVVGDYTISRIRSTISGVCVINHPQQAPLGEVSRIPMVLLPTAVGVFRFKESLSLLEIAGLAMAVGSLLLLTRFN